MQVPIADRQRLRHQQIAVDTLHVAHVAELVDGGGERIGVVVQDRIERIAHQLAIARRRRVAEVEERHPSVLAEQVVAWVWVGVESTDTLHRAVVEAHDDLPDAVALRLVEFEDLVEVDPIDPVGDEDTTA